jgi:hypothetical protein
MDAHSNNSSSFRTFDFLCKDVYAAKALAIPMILSGSKLAQAGVSAKFDDNPRLILPNQAGSIRLDLHNGLYWLRIARAGTVAAKIKPSQPADRVSVFQRLDRGVATAAPLS